MQRSSVRPGPSLEVPLLVAGAEAVFAMIVRLGTGTLPEPAVTLGFGVALALVLLAQDGRRPTRGVPDAR